VIATQAPLWLLDEPTANLDQATESMAMAAVARQLGPNDTVVLVTVVAAKNAKPGQDFFPLTIDYIEKRMQPARFLAAFSSVKAVPRKKRHSPRD
jgi:polyribonucleotide nucleotidyltransferase